MYAHHAKYYARYRRSDIKALGFALLLCGVLILSLIISFMSSGPIVLGTEMNTNGLVEYLCLGNGCEDLTSMDW